MLCDFFSSSCSSSWYLTIVTNDPPSASEEAFREVTKEAEVINVTLTRDIYQSPILDGFSLRDFVREVSEIIITIHIQGDSKFEFENSNDGTGENNCSVSYKDVSK